MGGGGRGAGEEIRKEIRTRENYMKKKFLHAN